MAYPISNTPSVRHSKVSPTLQDRITRGLFKCENGTCKIEWKNASIKDFLDRFTGRLGKDYSSFCEITLKSALPADLSDHDFYHLPSFKEKTRSLEDFNVTYGPSIEENSIVRQKREQIFERQLTIAETAPENPARACAYMKLAKYCRLGHGTEINLTDSAEYFKQAYALGTTEHKKEASKAIMELASEGHIELTNKEKALYQGSVRGRGVNVFEDLLSS